MPASNTRPVIIVTACMRPDGLPAFARTIVDVTDDQAENGIHFYLAEAELMQQGFEEPMVHFSEEEAPDFLLPAVEHLLGVVPEPTNLVLSEKS